MLPIELLPGAHLDYDQSFDWYASKSPQTAIRFADAIQSALDEIAGDPQRFASIDGRHRERLVARFPFRIIYRIGDDRIVVVAIAHAKRNPNHWQQR